MGWWASEQNIGWRVMEWIPLRLLWLLEHLRCKKNVIIFVHSWRTSDRNVVITWVSLVGFHKQLSRRAPIFAESWGTGRLETFKKLLFGGLVVWRLQKISSFCNSTTSVFLVFRGGKHYTCKTLFYLLVIFCVEYTNSKNKTRRNLL